MGTRNLTMVKVDGKIKVAQYCQWDGYPTGQGKDIAKFIHSKKFDLKTFAKNVAKLKWASKKEIKDSWTQAGADPNEDSVTFDIDDKHTKMFPEFSRNTGAGVLPLIQAGKISKVKNDRSFLKDGLYCEWAYLINLDNKTISVYVGGVPTGKFDQDGFNIYSPCKIIKRFKFEEFTVKAMKKFEDSVRERGE